MKKIKVCLSFLIAIMLVLSSTTVSYALLPPEDEEMAQVLFKDYYEKKIGEAINISYCQDVFYNCPGTEHSTKDYFLIHFDSKNAEEKPYYNRFGDKNEYFEYSKITNKLYESGFAVYYGDPLCYWHSDGYRFPDDYENNEYDDEFMSLPELYEKNPDTFEYILNNYKRGGNKVLLNQHSFGKVGEAVDGIIEGSVITDEDDPVDLSGIKIDVYKYINQYNRVFDSTVYTDSDGSFSFARPSETFLVEADPNSLPPGYGDFTYFSSFRQKINNASIKIARINSFEHNFFSNDSSLATTFYGKNGELPIKVPDYCLEYDTQQVKEAFLSDGVVNLKCDFGNFSLEKQMPTDEISMVRKIMWLYENNLITEEEEIKYLAINLNNNRINSNMDVPSALDKIGIYINNNEISDELKPYIDSLGLYNQVETAPYLFDEYYKNEIGEAVNESYCGDEFDDYPGSLDYYLIHFDSINAEEKPYYNRFGDKNEYFEYSEMTNKLYESGFAIIYGNPYNTKNTDKFKSLPELYEINPGTVEYMLKNYNRDGSSEIMKKHCWGKVGDADGDYELTIADATQVQKHLAGLTTLEGAGLKAADIGNKGEVNISDATRIQLYLADLVDKL